jgi:hypothetical protein
MKTSFDSMVSKVFEFLDVDCIKIENRMINPNTVNRSSFVSKYLRHPPKPLRVLKRLIMGRGRNKLYNYLLEINTKYEKRVNISSSLKSKIMTNYLEEICKTETLLGKNLDEWKGKKQ